MGWLSDVPFLLSLGLRVGDSRAARMRLAPWALVRHDSVLSGGSAPSRGRCRRFYAFRLRARWSSDSATDSIYGFVPNYGVNWGVGSFQIGIPVLRLERGGVA